MAYDFNSLTKQADEAINRDKFYTDFEDVDPSKLHQISELTEWLRTKGKGSDVREVIAQLFERTWLENIKDGNANMEVAQARGQFETLSSRLSDMIHRIQNVTSGSPKGVYDNISALQSDKPNGDSGIYVTTDNGHWYYYNGGWKDGGVYQSTAIDLKLTDFSPELLDMFNFNAKLVTFPIVEGSFYSTPHQQALPNEGAFRSERIEVSAGELYYIEGYSYYDGRVIAFVDNNGNVIESHPDYSNLGVKVSGIFEVPQNVTGLYLTCQNSKPLLLVKINDIYPKLGELALVSKTNLTGWEEIPIEIFKQNYYYDVYKVYPLTKDISDRKPVAYNPVAVKAGETYRIDGTSYWDGRLWMLIDKEGKITRKYEGNDQDHHTNQVTIEDGEVCLLLNSGTIDGDVKLYKGKIDKSKKGFTVIGDSWTDPATLGTNPNWVDFCKQLFDEKYKTDLDIINLGSGGTGFMASNGQLGKYSERVIPTSYNTYVIIGSFNDAFASYDFGDVKICAEGTLFGGMADITSKIYATNPDAKILFVTPAPWGSINPKRAANFGPRDNAAEFAEEYVGAMIEYAKYNSIPILDLYHFSNLRPWDGNFVSKFYHGTSETDDTHANSDGHKRIAPQIADFIFKEF
ncbi:Pectinesterase [Streptococcus infantarius subsp. infantarius]|nr:Pectinesterase [Streptococcus infantarius subsp. infantarius]